MHYIEASSENIREIFNNFENFKYLIDKKEAMRVLTGTSVGFGFFRLSSHPKNKLSFYHRLPKIKISAVEILPNLKFKFKNYFIHIHHWIWASALLWLAFIVTEGWSEWTIFKGLMIGAIVQGLTYKSRFKILLRTQKALQNRGRSLP